MKTAALVLNLSAAMLASASWACTPPPPVAAPALPAGLDGRLPVTYPDKDPNYPYKPPITNGSCPAQVERYGQIGQPPSLTDGETDRVYGNSNPTAPTWDAGKVYNTGDLVSLDGAIYKAKWWTQNEKPGQAWGAWEIQAAQSGPQLWSASKAYQGGEQAVFNGRLYQARWWTQNNPPDQAGSPWEDKGAAPTLRQRPPQFSSRIEQQADQSLRVSVNAGSYIYPISFAYIATASCTAQLETRNQRPPEMVPPSIERWEVRVDGKVVASQSGPQMMYVPAPMPPAPPVIPRNADGSCSVAAGTVVAQFNSSAGGVLQGYATIAPSQAAGNYVSVWLCNGDICRPSTLLAKYKFGQNVWP
ncbi:carbohydrate-binding protein [Chitinibacter sp. ZOR0017]|uniref:carbohydrate-binding protein n=1 Tax=Chitinibacter sp. ZOR0017 TaxID=1339254 RepID=UPI000647B723|nr:carbohydrate-binding protein [Chitinibacter sp. ZOR0017]